MQQDSAKAVALLQLAADQGDAKAQYSLGTLDQIGNGVEQDSARAAMLLQQAADQGDADAIHYLELQRRKLQHKRLEAEARAAAMADELIRDEEEQASNTKGKQSKKKKKKIKGKGSIQAAQVKLSHLLALSIDTCVAG